MIQECKNCTNQAETLQRCTGCSTAWYCNSKCQKEHWLVHIVDCNPGRPITSADRLIASVIMLVPPEDPTTRLDYGFSQVLPMEDHHRKLQVFGMLIEDPQIKSKTIHRWMEAGNLGAMMREKFDARLPLDGHKRVLYNWFCKHQSTFDRSSELGIGHEATASLDPGPNDAGTNSSRQKGHQQQVGMTANEALNSHIELSSQLEHMHLGSSPTVDGTLARTQSATEDQHAMRAELVSQAEELCIQAISSISQYESSGDINDIDLAIECWRIALALTPHNHESRESLLINLGAVYGLRFEHLGRPSDLSSAIQCATDAVALIHDGHPDKAMSLKNLGILHQTRFQQLGDVSDLNMAVEYLSRATLLTPDSDPDKPVYFNSLGNSNQARFERLGDMSDLDQAVECRLQAVMLAPSDHPSKPGYLNNLGISYKIRFERLGSVSDLNQAVERQFQAVSLTPSGHQEMPGYLSNLGNSYQTRFRQLGSLLDLSKAVECQSRAVSLAPDGHPCKPGYLNNLGLSYKTQFKRLGNVSDLDEAIKLQSQAVSLTSDGHPNMPGYLDNLGSSCQLRFERLGSVSDINQAVDHQLQAVSLAPDGSIKKPVYLSNLGSSYRIRFERLGSVSDLNQAVECQSQAVSLTPDGHPGKLDMLSELGNSYQTRFKRLESVLDLNQAVDCHSQAALLTPNGHPGKPTCLNNLGISYRTRFERLGNMSDLNKAVEYHLQAVSLIPDDHPNRPGMLSNLAASYSPRFRRLGDVSDLNEAVERQLQAVSLTPDDHPDKPMYLNNLGALYQDQFKRLGNVSDLNEAIKLQSQAVSLTPDGHSNKPTYLNSLGILFRTRFERLGDISDIQSALSSFQRSACSLTGPPVVRFYASQQWARLSEFDTVSTLCPAYSRAIELLPQLVWIGTTLEHRYELIEGIGDFATEGASYAISFRAFDLALEWLEAGRSIVWSQIAQLRTPFDRLFDCNPNFANSLREVSRKLELAGSRSSYLPRPNDSRDLMAEAHDHIQLGLDWDRLLAEARSIPGFEDFLCYPRFSCLLGAAQIHPLVIVNAHKSRCDALILRPGSSTASHIHLAKFSIEKATRARDTLVSLIEHSFRGFKKAGQSNFSGDKPIPLDESMKDLWLGVVKPVLDHLGILKKSSIPQFPHITWCTTGILSFLPLHAAGCYDQSGPNALDYVVSSYTPTVSALLKSQSYTSDVPSGVLAVGQEYTPGLSRLPYAKDELRVIQVQAKGCVYLQLANAEATIDRVLDAMGRFGWVHLACHGTQHLTDPTKSAFHLQDGPLTLATIAKQSFTNKGLAFLSACQTATGDENMPDEAVHLAAGMLIAGYPSVIGTMWSMVDEDGPEVASRVYAELLKDGEMDHTKAAMALHQAVVELRAKVGVKEIARWAPFIHIGS